MSHSAVCSVFCRWLYAPFSAWQSYMIVDATNIDAEIRWPTRAEVSATFRTAAKNSGLGKREGVCGETVHFQIPEHDGPVRLRFVGLPPDFEPSFEDGGPNTRPTLTRIVAARACVTALNYHDSGRFRAKILGDGSPWPPTGYTPGVEDVLVGDKLWTPTRVSKISITGEARRVYPQDSRGVEMSTICEPAIQRFCARYGKQDNSNSRRQ